MKRSHVFIVGSAAFFKHPTARPVPSFTSNVEGTHMARMEVEVTLTDLPQVKAALEAASETIEHLHVENARMRHFERVALALVLVLVFALSMFWVEVVRAAIWADALHVSGCREVIRE